MLYSKRYQNLLSDIGAEPIVSDITNYSLLEKAMESVSNVVHFAAVINPANMGEYKSVNIEATKMLA